MDSAYAAEVLRILELLRVALISDTTPESARVANAVERFVREYLKSSVGQGEER